MPYEKGQPKEETSIVIGVGNHILVRWLNTFFDFPPEGGIEIFTETEGIFSGGELDLWQKLGFPSAKKRRKR